MPIIGVNEEGKANMFRTPSSVGGEEALFSSLEDSNKLDVMEASEAPKYGVAVVRPPWARVGSVFLESLGPVSNGFEGNAETFCFSVEQPGSSSLEEDSGGIDSFVVTGVENPGIFLPSSGVILLLDVDASRRLDESSVAVALWLKLWDSS
jgi:hypothetical protein